MSIFRCSAAEFKNLRSLVTAALLIALHTVFALFVSIQVTESLRISISFVINVVIGCLYGPVMGLVCGALGDIVQFVIKPTGPYFPGWTLNAALACFIYGIFFYKRFPARGKSSDGKLSFLSLIHIDAKFFIRTIIALTLDTLIVNVLLGTYWVTVMYGKGFAFYFATRFTKNMIQLPINILLSYYVLAFVRDIRSRVKIE